ncbi:glycoside hydrolase superfamily [Halenospora varia]|nr:glycoside hydrolase superfamily [Halenospora varia]
MALVAFVLFLIQIAQASGLHERSSKSFAGSNSYYLHGLLAQEQASYIQAIQADGGKVVRLWVTGIASNCTKSSRTIPLPNYEVTIGRYETSVLDAIDNVLFQLHTAGIKAIISPHDANLLPPNGSTLGYNGIDIYGRTYSTSYSFYTNSTARKQYRERLVSILEYVSPSFNKKWADLSEAILAFDIQNEPMIASPDLLKQDDPTNWLCFQAQNMKKYLRIPGISVATGGIGGSQYVGHEYNLLPKALKCSSIDIMSVHGYMDQASQWAYYFPKLLTQTEAAGKNIMVEEWGVNTIPGDDSVETQAQVFNNAGVPWLYWMTIRGKSVDQSCTVADGSCCHVGLSTDARYDFEISLTSSRANWSSLYHTAGSTAAAQRWNMY